MSVKVVCDRCSLSAAMVSVGVEEWSLPKGWKTPLNDNDRAVYRTYHCSEVCANCENALFVAYAERRT